MWVRQRARVVSGANERSMYPLLPSFVPISPIAREPADKHRRIGPGDRPCPQWEHRTTIAHGRLALREFQLEAARTAAHGRQILTFEQCAARLAGGLVHPVDSTTLRAAGHFVSRARWRAPMNTSPLTAKLT